LNETNNNKFSFKPLCLRVVVFPKALQGFQALLIFSLGFYCCNLSGGVALIVWFTTNGMCVKNKNISMWREQAIIEWSRWCDLGEWPLIMLVNLVNSWWCLLTVTTRVISSGDLYCCLLRRCEALRACRSGFPIATLSTSK